MTITEIKGQMVFALEAGETTKMVREATGKQRIVTIDDPDDWDLHELTVNALVAAGADMSKVKRIGWEIK